MRDPSASAGGKENYFECSRLQPSGIFRSGNSRAPAGKSPLARLQNHPGGHGKFAIAELQTRVGAEDFCMQEFFATEASLPADLLLIQSAWRIPARLVGQNLSNHAHAARAASFFFAVALLGPGGWPPLWCCIVGFLGWALKTTAPAVWGKKKSYPTDGPNFAESCICGLAT